MCIRYRNKLFRLYKKRPSMTEEEFRIIVTDIKNEGVLNQNEHDIIQNTIRYDELPVSAVMTKAENITAVDLSRPLTEIKGMFEESNYSRVPVVDKSLDSVLGIMYRAEFYEMLLNGKTDIKEILKPAFYTSPDEKISLLFKTLQKSQQHLAIAVKDGKTVGLISLEDILEELVGEMNDKYDTETVAATVA